MRWREMPTQFEWRMADEKILFRSELMAYMVCVYNMVDIIVIFWFKMHHYTYSTLKTSKICLQKTRTNSMRALQRTRIVAVLLRYKWVYVF